METRIVLFAALCFVACDKKQPEPNAAQTAGTIADVGAEEPDLSTEPAGPTFTAFDFIGQRHLAHMSDGGLVVDVGHPSAVKYVDGTRWYEGFSEGEALVSNPKGSEVTFTFPLGGPHESGTSEGAKLELRFRPLGSQTIDVVLNDGTKDTTLGEVTDVGSDWQTKSIALPDGLEYGRDYSVRFEFSDTRGIPNGGKSSAEIDWFRVATGEQKTAVDRREKVFDTLGSRIRLQKGDAVWWNLIVPERAEFVAGGEGLMEFIVAQDGKKPKRFETGMLGKFEVDLGAYAGKPVRLGLVANGDASVTRPRLDVPKSEPKDREEHPKFVVIWAVEGLRADAVSLEEKSPETPNLAEFAKNAVHFERAVAQAADPAVSLTTLMTMGYPPTVQGKSDGRAIPYEATVFGEPLQNSGWTTGYFTHSPRATEEVGLKRGFDQFVAPSRKYKPETAATDALFAEFEPWLRERSESTMAMVYTVDTTAPFPTSGEASAVDAVPEGLDLQKVFAGNATPSAEQAAYLKNQYRSQVTRNDAAFGKLLSTLDDMGIRDKTLIVFASTGGVLLGEYGKWGPTAAAPEVTHVPLLIQYTPWTVGGGTVSDAVELIDIYRTTVDAVNAGRVTAVNYQGADILELAIDDTPRAQRVAFAYGDGVRIARVGDWELERADDGNVALYRLGSGEDGQRGDDVSATQPSVLRLLRDALGFQLRYETKWDKSEWGPVNLHGDTAARKLDKRAW